MPIPYGPSFSLEDEAKVYSMAELKTSVPLGAVVQSSYLPDDDAVSALCTYT
jgi:hypothetical protein